MNLILGDSQSNDKEETIKQTETSFRALVARNFYGIYFREKGTII